MYTKIITELKKIVSKSRYEHSIRVAKVARELAKKYGADEEKVVVTALIHDIAKEMSLSKMQKICKKYFMDELEEKDMENKEILHGFAGAYVAKHEFGIKDKEILDGIKYHTIGKKGLSLLGRIVYIADSIEPKRDYPLVDEIRKKVRENLNEGILMEINKKIEYLDDFGITINKNTIEMRKWLKKKIKEEREKI